MVVLVLKARLVSALFVISLVFNGAAWAAQGSGTDLPGSTPKTPRTPKSGPPKSGRGPGVGVKPKAPARIVLSTGISGCVVYLNDEYKGMTDAQGSAIIADLAPGTYQLRVRKDDGYSSYKETIELRPGENRRLAVTLTMLHGLLNVSANVPDAEIDVSRIGKFFHAISSLSITPGDYRITVSKSGFRPAVLDVSVRAGQTSQFTANLERMSIKELMPEAEELFNSERFAQAIAICSIILTEKQDKPGALLLLGASHFRNGDYDASVSPLVKAVKAGEQIVFRVQLQQPAARGNVPPGALGYFIVRNSGIGFRCDDASRRLDFYVPAAQIREVSGGANRLRAKVAIGDANRVRLPTENSLEVSAGPVSRPDQRASDLISVPVDRPVATRKPAGKTADMEFHFRPVAAASVILEDCPNCPPSMDVLARILQGLQFSGSATPLPTVAERRADPPGVVRLSGAELSGKAVQRAQPPYPQAAKSQNVEGAVVVEVTVNEAGEVISAQAVSGPALLRDAAVQAARRWRFTPTTVSGVAVKVIGPVTFNFRKG